MPRIKTQRPPKIGRKKGGFGLDTALNFIANNAGTLADAAKNVSTLTPQGALAEKVLQTVTNPNNQQLLEAGKSLLSAQVPADIAPGLKSVIDSAATALQSGSLPSMSSVSSMLQNISPEDLAALQSGTIPSSLQNISPETVAAVAGTTGATGAAALLSAALLAKKKAKPGVSSAVQPDIQGVQPGVQPAQVDQTQTAQTAQTAQNNVQQSAQNVVQQNQMPGFAPGFVPGFAPGFTLGFTPGFALGFAPGITTGQQCTTGAQNGVQNGAQNGVQVQGNKPTDATDVQEEEAEKDKVPPVSKPSENAPSVFKINALINTMINISLNATIMVTLIILFLIILLSLINFVILLVVIALNIFTYDSDMIYKDSLKYKILQYIDFYNVKTGKLPKKSATATPEAPSTPQSTEERPNKSVSEPYFMIYGGTMSLLSLIYMAYAFLLIICLLCIVLFFIFRLLMPLIYRGFKIDNDTQSSVIPSIMSFAVLGGIIVAAILGIFHWAFFNNVINGELSKLKNAIHTIDLQINTALTRTNDKFNKDLFNLLKTKSKGIEDFEEYESYIQTDVRQGALDKAKQKIILIILYSHLYDNIPYTNNRAKQLVNYYFFQDPDILEDSLDFRITDELNDLTFISLIVEKNGIKPIADKYVDYDFFATDNTAGLNKNDVEIVKKDIQNFMKELNDKLIGFPAFKNNIDVFAVYIVIYLVLSFLLAFVFFLALRQAPGINEATKGIAKLISKIMMHIAPPLAAVTANLTDPSAYEVCKTLTDPKQKKTCSISVANGTTYVQPPENEAPTVENIAQDGTNGATVADGAVPKKKMTTAQMASYGTDATNQLLKATVAKLI
jgi:hypothetical protein